MDYLYINSLYNKKNEEKEKNFFSLFSSDETYESKSNLVINSEIKQLQTFRQLQLNMLNDMKQVNSKDSNVVGQKKKSQEENDKYEELIHRYGEPLIADKEKRGRFYQLNEEKTHLVGIKGRIGNPKRRRSRFMS
mmetsp:Transcript_1600/g.1569  ORF Transcript_1600/g.1569 Transcript_1600/m.1569 type:complete len:135 (-) Transcript_1600:32-436(-)